MSRSSINNRPSFANQFLNSSFLNVFSPPSTSSSEEFQRSGARKGVSEDHNRRIVNEIINNIFDDKAGNAELSSSQCSSLRMKDSEYSFDKRLKYWKDMLLERKVMEWKINKETGKKPEDILFNRQTTVDDRDKQTVKRILDYADRMEPIVLMEKKRSKLREYVEPETCRHVKELHETLPQAEKDHYKIVEISGIPAAIKEEMLGKRKRQGVKKKSEWLRSKVLERRIEEKREDIERVIEYYPDIEHLQIVGDSMTKSSAIKHNSDIELIDEEKIRRISTDTSLCEKGVLELKVVEEVEGPVEYGVKINDQIFILLGKRSAKSVDIEVRFECVPFEKVVKRVCRVENVGTKVLTLEWSHRAFYDKNGALLKANDEEFVFNRRPFRLMSGETRDIIIQFQPRKVDIIKERWILKIDPQFFCRKADSVVLNLSGKCRPPAEYLQKIKNIQTTVIEKSNFKMMRRLTTGLGSLTPLIKPDEVICPYRRILNDRELFEFYNIGYKCERYHDLELLKDIHKRVKKAREPAWDLKLENLKTLILRVDVPDQRAFLFAEMMGILEEMKGTPMEIEQKMDDNPERERTRFLYVRGIICTGIDEWEDLAVTVHEAFMTTALKEYYDRLAEEEQEVVAVEEESQTVLLLMNEDEIKEHLWIELRHRKAFRDTLYMQTYTHLCDCVENIVSIIESTEII